MLSQNGHFNNSKQNSLVIIKRSHINSGSLSGEVFVPDEIFALVFVILRGSSINMHCCVVNI